MPAQSAWALIQHQGTFVFIKRSANTSRLGQWCVPGGSCHQGETPEAACIREVQEETALHVSIINPICQLDGFHYFLCQLESTPTFTLKPNECTDAKWVSPQAVLQLGEIMELKRMRKVFGELGVELGG